MSRLLRASIIILLLASCGARESSAPRNLDDACALSREKPDYFRAMQSAERRWGIPVHVQMAVIHQESKFIGDAKTPHRFALGIIPMGRQSSAYGYSQALDATWDEYRDDQRRRGARRDRIDDATDFMGWYMHISSEKLGISKFDAQAQYLAYHEGRTGFAQQSYLAKDWLMEVSAKVQERANMYGQQLAYCSY